MSNNPQTLPNYSLFSEFNAGAGRDFGNPILNLLLNQLMGNNYMPTPTSGQSMHDAFVQQRRSMDMDQLRSSSFLNNNLFKSMGISDNPVISQLSQSMAFSGPDSPAMQLLNPLVGGNPVAATMHMYASMAGASAMGGFGRTSPISARETKNTMQALTDNFYNLQSSEEVKNESREKTRDFLKKQKPEVLKDLGVDPTKVDSYDIIAEEENLKRKYSSRMMKISDIETRVKDYDVTEDKTTKQKISQEIENTLKKDYYTSKKTDPVERKKEQVKMDEDFEKQYMSRKGLSFFKTFDLDKARQEVEKGKDMSPLEKEAFKDKSDRYKGINFANTRGYKVEDFESAFAKAAELRMLGDNVGPGGVKTKKTPKEAMQDFMKGGKGGQFMDAAKSLFGDKSGGELIEDVSKLIGRDKVNLGDQTSVDKISDLMRRAKATAKVAGVSLNAMFSIIESTQELFKNNPQLQGMSQTAITNMSLKNIASTASMGIVANSNEFRRLGNSQGVSSAMATENYEYAQSSKAGFIAAAALSAKQAGNFEEFQKAFEAGEFSSENLARGDALDKISKLTKKSVSEVVALGNSVNADIQQAGLADEQIGSMVLNKNEKERLADFYTANRQSELMGGPSRSREATIEEYKTAAAQGMDVDTFFNQKFISENQGNPQARKMAKKNKMLIIKDLLESRLSEPEKAEVQESIQRQADLQEKLSKKFAGKNASAITQAMSALSSGQTGEKITEDIKSIFTFTDQDTPEQKRLNSELQNNVGGVMKKLGSGVGTTEAAKDKDLLSRGYSQDINKYLKAEKELLKSEGNLEQADKIKGATTEELQTLLDVGKYFQAQPQQFGNKESRMTQFEELKAREKAGTITEDQKKLLAGLKIAENVGALEDDDAFSKITSGTLGNITSGIFKGGQERRKERYKKELETEQTKETGILLDKYSNKKGNASELEQSKAIEDARAFYLNKFGGDKTKADAAMVKDYEAREDKGAAAKDNYFAQSSYTDAVKNDSSGKYSQLRNIMQKAVDQKSESTSAEGYGKPGMTGPKDPLSQKLEEVFKGIFGNNAMAGINSNLSRIADGIGVLLGTK